MMAEGVTELSNSTQYERQGGHYRVHLKCSNCGYGYPNNPDPYIPKGITVEKWVSETECSKCGCKGTFQYMGGG